MHDGTPQGDRVPELGPCSPCKTSLPLLRTPPPPHCSRRGNREKWLSAAKTVAVITVACLAPTAGGTYEPSPPF
jgi:hypothetical protein